MYHLAYDDADRLTSFTTPGGVTDTFTYNGLGLRVGKTDSTGTYTYLCDGTSPGSAVLSDGHAVYTPGLSERRGGVSSYYCFEQAGNLWTVDGAGKSQLSYQDNTGFGTVTAGTPAATPFQFGGANGCQTDKDTGLVLMGHRYYDTRIGRFISQDPAGSGDNWYAYAGNNPVNMTDPSGLSPSPSPDRMWSINGGTMSDAAIVYGMLGANGQWWIHYHFETVGNSTTVTRTRYWVPNDDAGIFDGVGEAFATGLAATASVGINYNLYNGGSYRHKPGFSGAQGLANFGVDVASFATGLGEAKAATSLFDLFKIGCFIAGTPVQTQGKTEPIETVRKDELVATRDPKTGKTEFGKVVRTFSHLAHDTITAQFADAETGQVVETLTATPEHPFFVAGQGFASLGSLGVGTLVVTRAGPPLVVKSLARQHSDSGVLVYNLEVEGDHTYFVGNTNDGIWVHNLCNAADIVEGLGLVKGKAITVKQALDRIRSGLDVFAGKRAEAKALAKAASGANKAIGPELHGSPADGFYSHFHPDPRNGSHIFYP